MTALSKFFHEHVGQRKCQDILHPETCVEHFKKDILLFTLSNLKYFAPICLLPALIKIKAMNKNKLRKMLEYYLSCSVIGTSIGLLANLNMCLMRNIYGRFHYYTFVFIPAYLSAFVLYLGPTRVINLFETCMFQCMIETFLYMRTNILSRMIVNSKIVQTSIFMICSAIILHTKRMHTEEGFWLLSPNPNVYRADDIQHPSKCHLHGQSSCRQYFIDGIRNYFILGIFLDLFKMLITPAASTHNQLKYFGKLRNFRIRSVAFFTAYIGIYRFAHCWFNSKRFYSDIRNHIISSLLAGCSYYLHPQPTLFSFGLVQAIGSFWKCLKVSNIGKQNKALELILSTSYGKAMFPFATASLIHLNVMQPKHVSPLAAIVINGIANKYPTYIQNEVNLLKAKFKFEESGQL